MRVVVLGAGVSGLAAALEVQRLSPETDVCVLEASRRAGGVIHSEHYRGMLLEHGPDSIAAFKPGAMEMVRELGLADQVVSGTGTPRMAYVASGNQLLPLPSRLLSFSPGAAFDILRSPLLSVSGKARALSEPLHQARRENQEESLASFVSRRFGREMLDNIIEPLVASVYGTSPDRLSASATLPKLVNLEQQHGSVGIGMLRAPKAPKTSTPYLVSLSDGMESITHALAAALAGNIRFGKRACHIARGAFNGFRIQTCDDSIIYADRLVLAVPAYVAAPLCEQLDVDLAHELAAVEYSSLASLHIVVPRRRVAHDMMGTGFVVPSREGRAISACTWVNQKWPNRAPEEKALLRCFLRDTAGTDRDLRDAALADLMHFMGLEGGPELTHIVRMDRALPRYTVEHREREKRIAQRVEALNGIALCGNMIGGMGVPECVGMGKKAAGKVLQ